MPVGEFELIQRYFADSTEASSDASVVLGIGDDCAILDIPAGQQLVVSIDTLVEGTHFLPDTAPELLASRLMGAAVSDLAAMGATPAWLTLALTLPESDESWLAAFSQQLHQLCQRFQITLIGGDTTRGPLALSAQVHGFVTAGKALRRQGAQVDDLICVSGCLGDSRAGLEGQLNGFPLQQHAAYLHQRFFAPEPRLTLGQQLTDMATSCIDISDGLLSDLQHILQASQVGARLQLEALPLSAALVESFGEAQAREWALSGGEDFELCFTLPATELPKLAQLDMAVAVVGKVTQAPDLSLMLRGEPYQAQRAGFDHFDAEPDL